MFSILQKGLVEGVYIILDFAPTLFRTNSFGTKRRDYIFFVCSGKDWLRFTKKMPRRRERRRKKEEYVAFRANSYNKVIHIQFTNISLPRPASLPCTRFSVHTGKEQLDNADGLQLLFRGTLFCCCCWLVQSSGRSPTSSGSIALLVHILQHIACYTRL